MEQLSKSLRDDTSVAQTEDLNPQCDPSEMNDSIDRMENSVPNIIGALEKHFKKYHPQVKIIKVLK
jgi:hypothetical protein